MIDKNWNMITWLIVTIFCDFLQVLQYMSNFVTFLLHRCRNLFFRSKISKKNGKESTEWKLHLRSCSAIAFIGVIPL